MGAARSHPNCLGLGLHGLWPAKEPPAPQNEWVERLRDKVGDLEPAPPTMPTTCSQWRDRRAEPRARPGAGRQPRPWHDCRWGPTERGSAATARAREGGGRAGGATQGGHWWDGCGAPCCTSAAVAAQRYVDRRRFRRRSCHWRTGHTEATLVAAMWRSHLCRQGRRLHHWWHLDSDAAIRRSHGLARATATGGVVGGAAHDGHHHKVNEGTETEIQATTVGNSIYIEDGLTLPVYSISSMGEVRKAPMEDSTSNSNKWKGDGEQDGRKSGCKRQKVTTMMEVFDCLLCSKPLRPPIFQCSKGNSICRHCKERLPLSERTAVQRCYIMERVVDNIFVPCKHGCSTTIAYYQKDKHERQCPCGPCLCPVSGCGFVAPTAVLLVHLTTMHKLPTTPMELFKPFEVTVQPGSRVLKTKYNRLFLLNMEPLESYGHGVSLVCVQPETPGGNVRITVVFSCAPGHNQESNWEMGPYGVPKQCLCIVRGKETDVVITITIEREDDDED